MKGYTYAFAALLPLAALAAGCGTSASTETLSEKISAEASPPEVATAPVAEREVPVLRELAGTVKAASISRVSARLMAQVVEVRVQEGDAVREGDLLARLDGRDLESKLRQAESGLTQARAGLELAAVTLARYRKLYEGKAISRQEYDQVAAREKVAREGVVQAEHAVEEARTWRAFTEIRAPLAGRVVARQVDEGSMAAPGRPLFSVEPEGNYQLVLPVDVSLSGDVQAGDSVGVSVPAAAFDGPVEVTEVVPVVDPVSRTFIVKADLPAAAAGFRSGQYARATLSLGTRRAAVVPASAVVRRGQLDGVYAAGGRDGRLAFRIVRLGREVVPGGYEVLSGLEPGETIVVDGAGAARDGLPATAVGRERG